MRYRISESPWSDSKNSNTVTHVNYISSIVEKIVPIIQ